MLARKVSMIGMYGVGKTSLVRRFVSSIFDETYHASLGVKVDKKQVQVDGTGVLMMLWDIAGAEKDFTVPMHYLKGSAGFLLVMDPTRTDTLHAGLELAAQIRAGVGDIPCVPLLNKCDLPWELDGAAIAELLAPLGVEPLETSALSGKNVELAFETLARRML